MGWGDSWSPGGTEVWRWRVDGSVAVTVAEQHVLPSSVGLQSGLANGKVVRNCLINSTPSYVPSLA